MIKGILFDKDGTLVAFSNYWVQCTIKFLAELYPEAGNEDSTGQQELLVRLGIVNGRVVEQGPIASGSSMDIAKMIGEAIHEPTENLKSRLDAYFLQQLMNDPRSIQPIGDISVLLHRLRRQGFILGVATGDDYEPTLYTLRKIEALESLSFVGTSDRFEGKPEPAMAEAFCTEVGLHPEEVVYVGDTSVDMQFARHLAYGIAVLSGVGKRTNLQRYTDHVILSVHDLLDCPL